MYVWFQSDFLWESDNPEPEESCCFVTPRLFPPTLRHLLQASKTSVTNLLLTDTNSASLSHTSNSTPCQDDQVSPRVSASTTPGLNTNRRLRSSPPSPLTLAPPRAIHPAKTEQIQTISREEAETEREIWRAKQWCCKSIPVSARCEHLTSLRTTVNHCKTGTGRERESLLTVTRFLWHS